MLLYWKTEVDISFTGDNVLVNSNGFYKIADFGITKKCHSIPSSPCLYTEGIGTDSHMAPEVKNVQSSYDTSSDIWYSCKILLNISHVIFW